MAAPAPTAARWPSVAAGRGAYESYYLRAVHPTEPRGVWIRYTVSAPAGAQATGQLWVTLFDREAPRPWALRVDAGPVSSDADTWIRMATARFGPTEAVGDAGTADGRASWSLRHESAEAPLLHLRRTWMYTARLPRTKLLSLRPAALFDGTLDVDGRTISVERWPGMVGHNWGEQHAASWIWLHGVSFQGAGPDTWLDVALARVRLGRVTTPWVANGAISLGGERIPLGGLGSRPGVTASDDHCDLHLSGRGTSVTASVSAPPEAFAEWDYESPDGSHSRVVNCSVADLTVRIDRTGNEPVELRAPARGVYELGREAATSRPS